LIDVVRCTRIGLRLSYSSQEMDTNVLTYRTDFIDYDL